MWAERADYGHFFYRIPNGESAADAYDRVSGFNESLWRQFGDGDFPSVCVLVTHGLMTRVFLMKWYHWSVEYFEDLRNVNHCEFILMSKNPENGKYILENNLRTWSELKRQRREQAARQDPQRRNTLSAFLSTKGQESPSIPPRKWGGCEDGCNHEHDRYPRRAAKRKEQVQQELQLPPAAEPAKAAKNEAEDHPIAAVEPSTKDEPQTQDNLPTDSPPVQFKLPFRPGVPSYLHQGRDGGGTSSGAATPHEMSDDEEGHSEYFPAEPQRGRAMAEAIRKAPQRKATPEDVERWARESGMGNGRKADALGDEPNDSSDDGHDVRSGKEVKNSAVGIEDIEKAEVEDKSLRGSVY